MDYWKEKIKIRSLEIPRFIGGPLDGITDSPFRQLLREFSQHELLYTEMRHVACVANDKTERLSLRFEQSERPLSFQVAACNEQFIEQACEKILAKGVDILDLNVGCPAPCVIKSGAGSALMADIPRLKKVLQCFRKNVPIPFTIKIRAGFKLKNAIEIAQLAQDCGVDALAIHPRLQKELFAGRPDYALAAEVKKSISIPVFLSGNIINAKTAQLAYEQTGVDGFLIGRGLWAKPWKLKELQEHAAGRTFVLEQRTMFTYALKHLDMMLAYYGGKGLYCFRKHLPFYLKGLPSASALRQTLVTSDSVDFVKQTIIELMN